MRKTKIVCTLGPASSSEEIMEEMLKNGMNVARLNFSHGTHESHAQMIEKFCRVRDKLGIPAAIMLDTKGPEIRLMNFKNNSVVLEDGQEFILTTEEILGDNKKASVTYKELPRQLTVGNRVLIDDGRVSMEVTKVEENEIFCKVLHGDEISNHKGVNIPQVHLDMPYLSEADKADILFGIEKDVDYIAASFVRSAEDVIALRKFLDYNGGHSIRIISKIENMEGIENCQEIIEQSCGIMVARGDMGVEVEYERLPGIQKDLIARCCESGRAVITATQMLDSMITNPNPTRAEITDVANAVFDRTSAIMLSGESANGKYPVRAVRVMAKIAEQAEADAYKMRVYPKVKMSNMTEEVTNAICDAACITAHDLKVKAIIAVTKTGLTARRMSKYRPSEPIVAATPELKTYHQLSLSWGVYPVMAKMQKISDELFQHAIDCAKQIDMVEDGDRVVITGGFPLGWGGLTNLLKVEEVGAIYE